MSYPVLPGMTDDVNELKWGYRFQGPLPNAEGASVDIVNNDQLPGFPGPVAVQLYRNERSNLAGPTNRADVHARITYGSGGASKSFLCDWQGQFSVVCNKIRITMETYAVSVDEGYTVSQTAVTVGAMIGLGSIPSGGRDSISFTSAASTAGVSHVVVDFARRYFPILVIDPAGTNTPLTEAELNLIRLTYVGPAGLSLGSVMLSLAGVLEGYTFPPSCVSVLLDGTLPLGTSIVHHFKLGL